MYGGKLTQWSLAQKGVVSGMSVPSLVLFSYIDQICADKLLSGLDLQILIVIYEMHLLFI